MRIAFCGKGGSGKTTLSSLFIRWLLSKQLPVLAIDGDINQHLGLALGLTPTELDTLPKLGNEQIILKNYVRGTNPRIKSVDHISESMPPGRGSNFIQFGDKSNPILQHFAHTKDNLSFIAIGGHTEDDIAATCYHRYTGAEGIFLNHLLDGEQEYVVGDMVAGADPFASSGLASRFDVIVLVVEPTVKSVEVFFQAQKYLAPFGLSVKVVGNKITDEDDRNFICDKVGNSWIGSFQYSPFVKKIDRGEHPSISELEPENANLMSEIFRILSSTERNWSRYLEIGIRYHQIVADSWGERWLGVDPMTQVDPDFSYESVL